jgi:anti-anti-sigma regulatory factor
MTVAWLEDSSAELAVAVARRLSSRAGSVFGVVGEAACRGHAAATLTALRDDLTTGRTEAVRAAVRALVDDLLPRGLGFSDLRYYIHSLKSALHGALAAAGEPRQAVDAWLLELTLVCSMHFVVHREEVVQQRAAQGEVKRLESQLAEIKAAFAEKSDLLERIRQTSTPIAPVVEGILVVPLVGVFDTLRAELLTERLLQAVGQAHARVVILDIGGVPVFDIQAAELIVRLAKAVRLLGTELILVGVSPVTAATIVELGVDLAGLRAQGSLQDGLALALRLRRLKIAPL